MALTSVVENVKTNDILNVYPNPSKAQVNFDLVFEKDMKNVVLEIVNLTGQKVVELYNGNVLEGAQNHFEFDASKFNEGIYFYHLKAEGKSVTGKVVIIK